MSVFIPRVGSGDLVFPICLQNLYTLCMQVLMKRKGRGEKNKERREKGKEGRKEYRCPLSFTHLLLALR